MNEYQGRAMDKRKNFHTKKSKAQNNFIEISRKLPEMVLNSCLSFPGDLSSNVEVRAFG
jgi:hypothetical protein